MSEILNDLFNSLSDVGGRGTAPGTGGRQLDCLGKEGNMAESETGLPAARHQFAPERAVNLNFTERRGSRYTFFFLFVNFL